MRVLSGFLLDVRYSVRTLARSPGVTLPLLFSIALGIGSNAVIHGLIGGLVQGRSGVAHQGQVVSIIARDTVGRGSGQLSYGEYQRLRARSEVYEWVGAAQVAGRAVLLDGRSAVMTVAAVTPDVARLFGLRLDQGVVVSHGAGDGVERVRIGSTDVAVAGLAAPSLEGLYADRPVDLWMTLHQGTVSPVWVLAKLRDRRTADQVKEPCCDVLPYTGLTPAMAADLRRFGTLLQVAAGLVLLIACANVASFQLGRAAKRLQETSLRVALGAGRARLARATLADSVVISLAGGALGVLLAIWTSRLVPALLFSDDAESLVQVPEPVSVLLWSATAMGIIVLCGLVPMFQIPHARPAQVLRRESSGGSKRSRAVRAVLVMAQMGSCWVLVVSTGYLYQGLRAALQTSMSRASGETILATVQAHPDVGLRYFQDIERAAGSIGRVKVRGWTTRLPGNQPSWQSFRREQRHRPAREVRLDVAPFTSESIDRFRLPLVAGRLFSRADHGCRAAIINEEAAASLFANATVGHVVHDDAGMPAVVIGVATLKNAGAASRATIYYDSTQPTSPGVSAVSAARFRVPAVSDPELLELNTNVVSPEYFKAAGFSVLAGRVFTDDAASNGCRVGVVNHEAAERYFGGNAAGAAVIDQAGRRTEIIGVVQSARGGTLQQSVQAAIYFPMEQDFQPRMTVLLDAPNASENMLAVVQRTLEAVPGSGPQPMIVRSLETYMHQTGLAVLRVATAMLGVSAATGLLLSVLGLYGTLSDNARRQSHDTALRIALGARPRDVIGQVLGQGLRLGLAGSIAGIAASVLISGLLSRVAMTGEAPPAWVWVAGCGMLAFMIAAASVLPARRSLMVSPVRALRQDP
ncbi:MAG TPA: FtsX-like permease family protein [Bryobacteraceae bacterium]|nr:FtsX-like permease family protein [Bryobacteraceae bacterium]